MWPKNKGSNEQWKVLGLDTGLITEFLMLDPVCLIWILSVNIQLSNIEHPVSGIGLLGQAKPDLYAEAGSGPTE